MSTEPNIKKPFAEFLHACFKAYRAQLGAPISDRIWIEKADEWHAKWHAAHKVKRAPRGTKPKGVSPAAVEIYARYPRHVGRAAALKAIDKALVEVAADTLAEAVKNYADATSLWTKDEKAFIPHPATWFNQERWLDDPKEWLKGHRPPDDFAAAAAPKAQAPAPTYPQPADWQAWVDANTPGAVYATGKAGCRASWNALEKWHQRTVYEDMKDAEALDAKGEHE